MYYIFCGGPNRFGNTHDTPNCVCQYFDSLNGTVLPHTHDFHEIFLVVEGEATHIINEQQQTLRKGHLVFIRAHDRHYFLKSKKRFVLYNFMFVDKILKTLFDFWDNKEETSTLFNEPFSPTLELTIHEQEEYKKFFSSISAIDNEDKNNLEANFRQFVFYLFSQFFLRKKENRKIFPVWLNELLSQMNRFENFSLGTKRLFELSPKSPAQLNRTLKKYLDVTATHYINNLRLTYISKMLATTQDDILNIILNSGFVNLSYAYRLFSQKYHCSPLQYRKNSSPNFIKIH